MYLGYSLSRTSFGITVSVILEAAIGAIVLVNILYFSPSLARVRVNPWSPSLAVE